MKLKELKKKILAAEKMIERNNGLETETVMILTMSELKESVSFLNTLEFVLGVSLTINAIITNPTGIGLLDIEDIVELPVEKFTFPSMKTMLEMYNHRKGYYKMVGHYYINNIFYDEIYETYVDLDSEDDED